jgi:NAD(P)-dependent dehydrogenase (short-subunit alcohol dehydrogenase family)
MSDSPTVESVLKGRLEGRRIILTGGASGIGRATAELFANEGAKVSILDQNGEGAERVAGEIGGWAFPTDLAIPSQICRSVAAAAQAMAGLDGIVNAAGITAGATVENTTLAMWDRTIAVNLTAPFLVVQAALPYLSAATRASVVNISSGAGLLPRPDRAAYTTSKGGLLALTRALAAELAPLIRVNAICPGSVETPLLQGSDQGMAARVDRYAMRRLGTAQEIANAILFLTSHESSYVTGVTLAVDGGRTFH